MNEFIVSQKALNAEFLTLKDSKLSRVGRTSAHKSFSNTQVWQRCLRCSGCVNAFYKSSVR